jgi:hypothetical protein
MDERPGLIPSLIPIGALCVLLPVSLSLWIAIVLLCSLLTGGTNGQ